MPRDGAARLPAAIGGTVWGPRGLIKLSHLWLPLAALLTAQGVEAGAAWADCLIIALVVGCWTQVCILANDLVDTDEDRSAGKMRWIAQLPAGVGTAVVGVMLAAGALAAGLLAPSPRALLAYAAAVVLGLAYSVRPVRLKERGALGPLGYALSAMLAFVCVPWAWLGGEARIVWLLSVAVLLDKWVNLRFHQVVDHAADSAASVQTQAVAMGAETVRAQLSRDAWAAALCLIATGAYMVIDLPAGRALPAALAGVAVAGATAYAVLRRRAGTSLTAELPALYLGATFGVLRVLPLALLARLALRGPGLWVVFCTAAVFTVLESVRSLRYRDS